MCQKLGCVKKCQKLGCRNPSKQILQNLKPFNDSSLTDEIFRIGHFKRYKFLQNFGMSFWGDPTMALKNLDFYAKIVSHNLNFYVTYPRKSMPK